MIGPACMPGAPGPRLSVILVSASLGSPWEELCPSQHQLFSLAQETIPAVKKRAGLGAWLPFPAQFVSLFCPSTSGSASLGFAHSNAPQQGLQGTMVCMGLLLPQGLGWPGGQLSTVTVPLHCTALTENFLSRSLVYRQVTLHSLYSAWGNRQRKHHQP